MNVIYEDSYLIVVEKPPGTPSQADKTGVKDMCAMVSEHVGGGYAGLVHRLDRPVGGLLVFAKKDFVCAKLSAEMAEASFEKTYLAVVCGQAKDSDTLRHFLIKNQRLNVAKVVHQNEKGAKEAILSYIKRGESIDPEQGALSLLEVDLKTGRHHQIRIQLAAAHLPIWGDTKYNEAFSKPKEFVNIALWAHKLSFPHPRSKQMLHFSLNPPDSQFPFSCFSNNK